MQTSTLSTPLSVRPFRRPARLPSAWVSTGAGEAVARAAAINFGPSAALNRLPMRKGNVSPRPVAMNSAAIAARNLPLYGSKYAKRRAAWRRVSRLTGTLGGALWSVTAVATASGMAGEQ